MRHDGVRAQRQVAEPRRQQYLEPKWLRNTIWNVQSQIEALWTPGHTGPKMARIPDRVARALCGPAVRMLESLGLRLGLLRPGPGQGKKPNEGVPSSGRGRAKETVRICAPLRPGPGQGNRTNLPGQGNLTNLCLLRPVPGQGNETLARVSGGRQSAKPTA